MLMQDMLYVLLVSLLLEGPCMKALKRKRQIIFRRYFLQAGVLVASLPSWRESAIEQRVGLPRLQQLSWQVEVLSASSEQTISNEPIVTLSFTTSGGSDGIKKDAEEMLAPRTFAVTMNQASLGTLLASMRRIKESLAAL
jgi:hypothetical protein